jgi:hypothetical protein
MAGFARRDHALALRCWQAHGCRSASWAVQFDPSHFIASGRMRVSLATFIEVGGGVLLCVDGVV